MADPKFAFDFMLRWEGGKSGDKRDLAAKNLPAHLNGIHTNMGVTWGTYQTVCERVLGMKPTPSHFLNLSKTEVYEIFKQTFWNEVKGDLWPQAIANSVVDFKYNAGKYAIIRLQKAINRFKPIKIAEDGIIGSQTTDAILSQDQYTRRLHDTYIIERIAYYQTVCDKRKGGKVNPVYLLGLNNRVIDLHNYNQRFL